MAPLSERTSTKPITGSGTEIESHQVDQPSAEPANRQPAKPASNTTGRKQPIWSQSVRVLGLALVVLAAIALFKLFAIGSGPKSTQFSNQAPAVASKDGSASKRQSDDNGQSIGLSRGPNFPAADNPERSSALLSDTPKIVPPAAGPILAAGTEQTTEPAN